MPGPPCSGRRTARCRRRRCRPASVVPLRLTDAAAVAQLVKDVAPDRVFHLAGYAATGGGDPEAIRRANVDITLHLLHGARGVPATLPRFAGLLGLRVRCHDRRASGPRGRPDRAERSLCPLQAEMEAAAAALMERDRKRASICG
jgi:hypothetical protein